MDEGLALAPGPATLNSGTGRPPGAGLTSQVDLGVLPKPTFVSNSATRKNGKGMGGREKERARQHVGDRPHRWRGLRIDKTVRVKPEGFQHPREEISHKN